MSNLKTTRNKQKESLRYKGFELVYRDLALPVYKFLIQKTGGNAEIAEEVSSRTFESALKGWDTFGHRSSYFTWVCKIALNKLADYYRSQIHQESKLIAPFLEEISDIEDKSISQEERLALKELRQTVKNCLLVLPKEKRQLLYLRFWEGLTIQKIARLTGMSERAAEGKIYRAKQDLKLALEVNFPEYLPKKH